jgi:predicted nucleic acid-binding protein
MIFVDAWAWIALAVKQDQYHAAARAVHRNLRKQNRRYVTTDFVLSEVISFLYRSGPPDKAQQFVNSVLGACSADSDLLIHVSADQFRDAWNLRQKYDDKPGISFVDFTSMVVMGDLGIVDIFTGDSHFEHVGLGFRLLP